MRPRSSRLTQLHKSKSDPIQQGEPQQCAASSKRNVSSWLSVREPVADPRGAAGARSKMAPRGAGPSSGGSHQETREPAGVALGEGEAFKSVPSLVPDETNMAAP